MCDVKTGGWGLSWLCDPLVKLSVRMMQTPTTVEEEVGPEKTKIEAAVTLQIEMRCVFICPVENSELVWSHWVTGKGLPPPRPLYFHL